MHGDANDHQAAEDFRINQEAKEDIERLQRELARIESEKLDRLLAAQEIHFASVDAISLPAYRRNPHPLG